MRRRILAGNWKMNKTNAELAGWFGEFKKEVSANASRPNSPEMIFAVPFTLLAKAREVTNGSAIEIAAQNVHFEASGAFTGEISTAMLKEIGVTTTLIGHSERRQYFGETDATVAKKISTALAAGMKVIVCIGETREERESGTTEKVVARQLRSALSATKDFRNFIIAYEPVWAIGTGLSATSAQAEEVHRFIRAEMRTHAGADAAESVRILYGGSASPTNIDELMKQPNIDGCLVGGASLKTADFARMVAGASF